jgi:glycerol-3-phosphate dehydrogenase
VVDKNFLPGNNSLLIPKTADGRVLFAVPWHQHLLLGTTDTPLDKHSLEPIALEKEVNFILETISQYLTRPPEKKDILAVFAGLRPLAATQNSEEKTKEISRYHKILISTSGLITITGGKWTTYRKMAEDVLEITIKEGLLPASSCQTKSIPIHGFTTNDDKTHLSVYGSDAKEIKQLQQDHSLNEFLVDDMPYTKAEVVWCIKNEMARTVEDVLARRLRMLFLNARAAIAAAPAVVEILKNELGETEDWKQNQLSGFFKLAKGYLP